MEQWWQLKLCHANHFLQMVQNTQESDFFHLRMESQQSARPLTGPGAKRSAAAGIDGRSIFAYTRAASTFRFLNGLEAEPEPEPAATAANCRGELNGSIRLMPNAAITK